MHKNQSNKHYNLFTKKTFFILGTIFCLPALLLSCSLLPSGAEKSLQATISAMNAQATVIAQQATQQALNIQATLLAQQALQLTQVAQPTQPPAVATQPPAETAQITLTTQTTSISEAELEEKIKSAKILLFEDISGNTLGLLRYIKESLDSAGYSYTDVGSAQGWLKDQLLSLKEWDLIIIASEMSGRVSGEYFDYIQDHLNRGTSVIIEM